MMYKFGMCRLSRTIIAVLLVLGWIGMLLSGAASAQHVDEPLPDAAQEAQARAIMEDVRCLVCQNQSIADSNADMAKDLRQIIREQIAAGKSTADVYVFLQERYGDWVLFSPPVSGLTILLWVGPILFLLMGAGGVWMSARMRHEPQATDAMPGDQDTMPPLSQATPSKALLVSFGVGLMVLAVALYMRLGAPGMQDQGTTREVSTISTDDPAAAEEIDLEQIYDDLRRNLAAEPDSFEGWQHMARVAGALDKFGEVANAFGQMARLDPYAANLRVMQAEALIRQAGGRVTPAARLALGKAAQIEPGHPAALYYEGLWEFQQNGFDRALGIWNGLLNQTADDDPWRPQLLRQIARANAQLAPSGTPQIEAGMADMVGAMSPEEQLAFIDSMIDRLRARLQDNPSDVEGWLRLAQAEEQMGRYDAAVDALVAARAHAPEVLHESIDVQISRMKDLTGGK